MHILSNVSLKEKNWFNVGGPAEFFVAVNNNYELQEAYNYSIKNNLSITILGLGANVLISDNGIKGLVISSGFNNKKIIQYNDNDTVLVEIGSGVTVEECINYCFDNNIIGLEEFSGIPSSIGGAIYINLHYFSFLISDFVYNGLVYDKQDNCFIQVDKEWFNFGYDKSSLQDKRYFLISVTFLLKKGTNEQIMYSRGRSYEIIRHRVQRYPYKGTCGSFFRNFSEDEVTLESNGKKIIYAGYYLDKVNVKGILKKGGAIVSHKHSNMIVNTGDATADDIIYVACEMQKRVWQEFKVMLYPECILLGFSDYPLMKLEE